MLLSPVFERKNRGLCSDCSQGQSASLLWFPNWKTVLLDRRTVSSISKYASQHPLHALPIQHVSFNFICLFCLRGHELRVVACVGRDACVETRGYPKGIVPLLLWVLGIGLRLSVWDTSTVITELSLLLSPECVLIAVYVITTSCFQEGVRRAVGAITGKPTETFQVMNKWSYLPTHKAYSSSF